MAEIIAPDEAFKGLAEASVGCFDYLVPIVSWTTPMLRAEKLLRDAGEDLEFRRDGEALDKLHEHLREVRRLIAFVQNRRAG